MAGTIAATPPLTRLDNNLKTGRGLAALLQLRQRGERVVGGVLTRGRREHRAFLAGIRIDSENQELGRDGGEIDSAVDESLRPLLHGKILFAYRRGGFG